MGTAGISQKTIGGISYAFHTLPASKAIEVWAALEPSVTSPTNSLSAVAAVGGKNVADIALKGIGTMQGHEKEAMIATLSMLSALAGLPEEDWGKPDGGRMMGRKRVIQVMFDHVKVGGKSVDLDVNFTGRLKSMYEVLGEALRINFSDFFSGLAEVTDSILAAAKPE